MILLKLKELFNELSGEKFLSLPGYLLKSGQDAPDVNKIEYDSRKLGAGKNGIIFACVRGATSDGHDFADEARRAGACALMCEHALPALSDSLPIIIVPNVRASMGEAAAILNGRPAGKLLMIALTGTNGKTTSAYITRSIMRASGMKTGMLGTIVNDDGQSELEAQRTTPEGPDIQCLLASMIRNGVSCCVMEASSHGLHQGRLRGCEFDRAGFSNLTLEHLEYHGDMENYFAAKRLLFTEYMRGGWAASVNADDEYGARLLAEFLEHSRGFSLKNHDGQFYRCQVIREDIRGTDLNIIFPDSGRLSVRSPFIGAHNASNVLESAAIADSLHVPREKIALGIENTAQVPGRLERFDIDGLSVFVDFAHSPDGLEKVLSTLSGLKRKGELWIVWGAGGDRAPQKRPVAGEIMARIADRVVITMDNPRSENPEDIAHQVEAGVISGGQAGRHEIILDRREAIRSALRKAQPGDVVLIAGKGPENYIDFGDRKIPFSDYRTVLEWAQERQVR